MSEKQPTKKELEAKVKQLESQVQDTQQSHQPGHGWRKFFAAVLIFLTAITVSTGIKAIWLRNTLFDTQTFTNKTTQIIQTPSVRSDLSKQLVDTIFAKVDVQKYVSDALPKQGQPLVGPITSALQNFTTEQVNNVLKSQQFVDFWKQANTSAHTAIIKSLNELNSRSQQSARDQVLFIDRDQVVLNIQPIIAQLKSKLSDAGLGFVNNLNTDSINATFTIATVKNLPIILAVFNGINATAFWMPILFLIFAAAAVATSTRRRRAMIAIAITTLVFLVIDLLTVRIGASVFTAQINGNIPAISTQSAQSIYHILTDDLASYYQGAMWLALIVIVFGVLAGPSKWAVWLRQHFADLVSGEMKLPAMQWLAQNAYIVAGALVAITAVAIILAPFSSITFAIWMSIIVGIICVLLISLKLAHYNKHTKKVVKKSKS